MRVLDIGSSRELCGGTHVSRTGDIGLFKVVGESGVAAGVRRIEGITGENALAYLQSLESTVDQAAAAFKAPAAELTNRIGGALDQIKALEKEIAALKGKLASSQGDEGGHAGRRRQWRQGAGSQARRSGRQDLA